jgi:hypothetical protein
MNTRIVLLSLLCLTVLAEDASAQTVRNDQGWTVYRNERFGFSLRYPTNVFEVDKTSEAGDGQVFASRDGEARLLVGTLTNEEGQSPAAYQDFIARKSYAQYRIGYRRLAGSWFVLSGEGDGKTFYEKVMFSCGDRLINSFALIYPTDQRQLFDRIVEGIEASFRPGAKCDNFTAGQPQQPLPPPRRAARLDRPELAGPRSALADRIARQRGSDVIVVLRRRGPPYDYKVIRGYATR